ncbi:MAG TPA: DUF885 family protein [Gemmatimonadales bacterium]|nr:DUF885 family protein [Gemmatimonadales bacterium]
MVSLTDELCASFRDLERHFDPSSEGRLGRFDGATVREHLAAFRAIEAGVEELEIEDSADEIDRTALLDDIRVTIFRYQHEQPHVRNPAFWSLRLCEALSVRRSVGPSDASSLELLKSIPAYLTAAEATLKAPPSVFIDLARALTEPSADLISQSMRDAEGDHEARAAALAAEAALARFSVFLETDLSPGAEERAPGVGEEEFERILHFRYALRAGAGEVWRYVQRLIEEVDGPVKGDGRPRVIERVREAVADLEGAAKSLGFPVPHGTPQMVETPRHRTLVEPLADYIRGVAGQGRFELSSHDWYEPMLAALAAENIVPGVHTLAAHAAGLRSRVRQTASVGDAGFGLYALAVLDEAGAVKQRELLLYRAVLARIDIGLHTGQMSLADALRLLADRFPMQPREALAAVRGVLMEPGAATGAIITRRELLRLRDDRRRATGEGFSYRKHHEEIMSYGGLPVSLIRWGLGVEE